MTSRYPGARVPRRTGCLPPRPTTTVRGRYRWLRWAVRGGSRHRPDGRGDPGLGSAGKGLAQCLAANWWWVLIAAAMMSMQLAQIQRKLLRSAGVGTPVAIRSRLLCGQLVERHAARRTALSATFMYRQQRIWGASPLVASWRLVMSGAFAGGGAGAVRPGRRIPARRQEQSVLAAVHHRRVSSCCCCCSRRRWRLARLLDGVEVRVLACQPGARQADGLDGWRRSASSVGESDQAATGLGVPAGRCSMDRRRRMSGIRGTCRRRAPSRPASPSLYASGPAVGSHPLMPGGLLVVEAVLVPGLVSSGMTLPGRFPRC